ncbi:hypothetical protein V6U81_19750 [Micromonospora sp. CPCC 205711]|uniref:hypothetical protein n=1 Tax=Micromonospora sp. CPCC 205547 TaxID=3122400 RepID=UPI002FF1D536
MPDDAPLPVSSDVDVLVVRDGPAAKRGKFRHRGVLLEVTALTWDDLGSPEVVVGSWVFAPSFRRDTVIVDPTGRLAGIRGRVSAGFADPEQVRRRCAGVRERIEVALRALDNGAPLHTLVMGWLFPTTLPAVLPVVAALRDPTVRRRYPLAREVLAAHGLANRYPELLDTLDGGLLPDGAAGARRVREHIAALAGTFDEAARVARTPFFFSGDVTAAARPVVVDGSEELVAAGAHREAMFWVVATYARCHAILAADAPAREVALRPAFVAALADVGAVGAADRRRRVDVVLGWLPRWWEVADAIRCRDVAG